MNLFKYNQFIGETVINENVQGAKKLLKDRYLMHKVTSELKLINKDLERKIGDGEKRTLLLSDFTPEQQQQIKAKIRETKLSDEEVGGIERNPEYIKIKDMLSENLGWCYIFTYFYFVENVSFEELSSIYDQLLDFKQLLNRLPKPLNNNFIDPNIPNNNEKLIDELEKLSRYRKLKRFLDQLPGDMRREYGTTSELYKEKIENIAVAFDDFGKKSDGTVDEIEKATLQKLFFSKIKRYKELREVIPQAENYIKGLDNAGVVAFYKRIEDCNSKFGIVGADIVFDENGILILDIKSFQANKMLNSNTAHCIASWEGQWSSYVGTEQDDKFNKQYYLYNFNLPSSNNKCIIGITIEPRQRVRACHDKADGYISDIRPILSSWERDYKIKESLWDQLAPMSDEDIAKKKRRIAANREITKPKLALEELERLVKVEGADINRESGKPLLNAVIEGSYEKVKYLLEMGASPNLRQKAESVINQAKTLDMIKLLVNHGAELTSQVFKNIMEDNDAVEYCLKAGMDPNFENSLPIRTCCKQGSLDTLKLLIKYGAVIKHPRNMPMAWSAENNRKDFMEYLMSLGVTNNFSQVKKWVSHTTKFAKKEDKDAMIDYIDELIKSGKVTAA